MNKLKQFLLTRRSIREYSKKEIEEEKLIEILKIAMYAHSAHNRQPWEFILMKNKEKMKEMAKIHTYASMLKQAKAAIVVVNDLDKQKDEGYFSQDCSAATVYILFGAWMQGIGSCWIGVYPKKERIEKVRNILKLPERYIPFSIISLGYPLKEPAQQERFDERKIHYDKW